MSKKDDFFLLLNISRFPIQLQLQHKQFSFVQQWLMGADRIRDKS